MSTTTPEQSPRRTSGDVGTSAGTSGAAKASQVISFLARYGLAAVWLVSGWIKILNPLETHQSVEAYQLLPDNLVGIVARGLPALEIALGLCLAAGLLLRASAWASAVLVAVFMVGIGSAWARGLTIDCGCFGGGGVDGSVTWKNYATELARDALFMALAVWTAVKPWRRLAVYV